MRDKGVLVRWNVDKAFGFIKRNAGGADVFIHKSAFVNQQRVPKVADIITFSMSKDKDARVRANEATFSGEKLQSQDAKAASKFSTCLSFLFLAWIFLTYMAGHSPGTLFFGYFGLSILTFLTYALDKSKAQRGAWRIQENSLHLLALLGGWPGAALAQQLFRHKSKKSEFRRVFWVTVIINIAGLLWLQFFFVGHL